LCLFSLDGIQKRLDECVEIIVGASANLQSSPDRIPDWSNDYQLPISVRNCSCIVLGNVDMSDIRYSIDDQPVNTVSEVRDLGVIVDFSLQFNSHITAILLRKQILVHP